MQRYYVCPWGLIQQDEVGGWGLIWFKNERFYRKKESEKFRRNIHAELALLTHAFRKYEGLKECNIMVDKFK